MTPGGELERKQHGNKVTIILSYCGHVLTFHFHIPLYHWTFGLPVHLEQVRRGFTTTEIYVAALRRKKDLSSISGGKGGMSSPQVDSVPASGT